MCGIAGFLAKKPGIPVAETLVGMLQALHGRGPDSTGYALYGSAPNGGLVMRYKLADANTPRDFDFEDRLRRHRFEVESRLAALGARIHEVDEETPYAFRVTFDYDGDLKLLADFVEDIPEAEVLSLGRALEIVKDLGDAETVHEQQRLPRRPQQKDHGCCSCAAGQQPVGEPRNDRRGLLGQKAARRPDHGNVRHDRAEQCDRRDQAYPPQNDIEGVGKEAAASLLHQLGRQRGGSRLTAIGV